MNVIKIEHDIYVVLKLSGAIWWEQVENMPNWNINDTVEVQYWATQTDCHTFECKVTQIIRTANSNRYVYRLVSNHKQ